MKKVDVATIVGLVGAFGMILLGNALEGGHLGSILQPTAALIVFGGTIGAVLISFPMPVFLAAVKAIPELVGNKSSDAAEIRAEIVRYAQKARREGILALENEAQESSNAFLRRAVMMAVDGVDSTTMQEILELEIAQEEERGELAAKVYEAAGGYAPTIGIIGAVLGLIHVMSNLSDVAKVGEGIAVAFVATIYGVGSANIVFLPFANKLKVKLRSEIALREMMLQGAIAMLEGDNPKLIEERLSAYLMELEQSADPNGDAASTADAA
jgi:chemotaxis protein MotA